MLPYGYLLFFVGILIPVVLIAFLFWNGEPFAPTVFLGIWHFMSWYVFYTKRLVKYPRNINEQGIRKLFFGWRGNAFNFWLYVGVLQTVCIGLLILYLGVPSAGYIGFIVAPTLAPFWTILHVTTSFLPMKPVEISVFKIK